MFLGVRFRRSIMILTPFILVGLVGYILDSDHGYLFKGFLFFLVSCTLNILAMLGFDERWPHVLPVGVYLGFKLWMYHTWLVHVAPHVSFLHTASILLSTIPIWYCYLKCWMSNPGVIRTSQNEKLKFILSVFEGEG